MNGAATFDWRTLGKADYSQASALVASLPEEQRSKLSGQERETLCRIVFLSWKQAERSGRGSGYCWPSENWLAKVLCRSVRSVRRYLTALRDLKLLSWKRRLSATGTPTTNLYQIGSAFLASLFARGKKKVQRNQDRTKMADNDLKREYKASAPIQMGERLTDFLARHRAERNQPLGAASFDSATDDWGTEETVVDRKALLKRQAQQLLAAEAQGDW